MATCNNHLFGTNTRQQIADIRRRHANKRIGFTASCFDLLHSGHVLMLQDAAQQCDVLVVALQTDPTLDRPQQKNKPIQSLEERHIMLDGIRHVDEIIVYATESDLIHILATLNPDVRIIGSDWMGKPYTGHTMPIAIHWHERTHDYSTSALRRRVYVAEAVKQP